MNHYPKRPVKSFQDLEVYQKTLSIAVILSKRIKNEKISNIALDLPVKIASAHSIRFSDQNKAAQTLEEVMLNCNLLVVYLEEYRDIQNKEIEIEFFEDQIKNLLTTRIKILHLQRSWKKFFGEKKI